MKTRSFALRASLLPCSVLGAALLAAPIARAATFTAATQGDWSSGATWGNPGNNSAGSGIPGSGDDAIIPNGVSVTVSDTESAASLSLNNGGFTSTTAGNLTVETLSLNGGNLQNNGTVTVSTALLLAGGNLSEGNGATLNLGGTISGTANLSANSTGNTFNYTGADQTVLVPPNGQVANLTFSGTGAVSGIGALSRVFGDLNLSTPGALAVPWGSAPTAVSGNLNVGANTTLITGNNFAVAGTTTINGELDLTGGTFIAAGSPGLNGTLVIYINDANTPDTATFAAKAGPLTFSGTLIVTNTGNPLVAGDTFRLFTASGYTGTFNPLILPALGPNLSWSNSLAMNGTLTVVGPASSTGAPLLSITNNSGLLTLSWDATTFPGYALQGQTNATGIGSNWTLVPNGDTSPVMLTIDPANPSVFFRLIHP